MEWNIDVIKLVGPTVPPKVRVVHANIFTVEPPLLVMKTGAKFDSIFFDIWPTIDTANLPDMARLHRRFAHAVNRKNPKAWMTSWLHGYMKGCRRRSERKHKLNQAAVGGDPMCKLTVGPKMSSITCKAAPYW